MKTITFYLFTILLCVTFAKAQETVFNVDTVGFCSVDGEIVTNVEGYTGNGYGNINNDVGVSIAWNINASEAGTYEVAVRYAFGGNEQNRNAELLINETTVADTVEFDHTGDWANWAVTDTMSVELEQGDNKVRIVGLYENGLPNIDHLKALGENLSATECTPSYTMDITTNIGDTSLVSYEPQQAYYETGTEITVHAESKDGHFFHSWFGEKPSTDMDHTFTITSNTTLEAMYYPEGTSRHPDATGYASVSGDNGTPFMMIGGALGDTVHVDNALDLESYLQEEEPLVIAIDGKIKGSGQDNQVNISSNKTLLGTTDTAHIEGIGLQVAEARNIIIRNLILSYQVGGDVLELTHNSRNIWIDSCEVFNDTEHHKDYYDELLSVKNAASYITISNSTFRDHSKGMLLSSGDQEVQDTIIRITYHHNYFHNLGSRIPSLRFGKAHVFNNYYYESSDGINTRMGACIRVEGNYFESMSKATHNEYSEERGAFHMFDNNIFQSAPSQGTQYTCELPINYNYDKVWDDPQTLPDKLPVKISDRVTPELRDEEEEDPEEEDDVTGKTGHLNEDEIKTYPNPADGMVQIGFNLSDSQQASVSLHDITGKKISGKALDHARAGSNSISFNTSSFKPGVYFYRLNTENQSFTGKFLVE